MATLAITITANSQAGAQLRRLAAQIEKTAHLLGDNPTGASTVLTIDNAPSGGVASVQLTAGPVTQATALIV